MPIAYDINLTIAVAAGRGGHHGRRVGRRGFRSEPLGCAARRRHHRRRRCLHALSRHVGARDSRPRDLGHCPGRGLHCRRHAAGNGRAGRRRATARTAAHCWLSALLLTLAIVSHHFTAMGAVQDRSRSHPHDHRAVAVAGFARHCGCQRGGGDPGHEPDQRVSPTAGWTTRGGCLSIALNNMTQGVVMFDTAGRLVVCNDRYLDHVRAAAATSVKPGCRSGRYRSASSQNRHRCTAIRRSIAPSSWRSWPPARS